MRNLLEEEEFIPLKKSPLYAETLKQFDQEIKPVFTSSSTRQFIVKLKGTTLTDYPDGNLKNNTMVFDRYGQPLLFELQDTSIAS
jgi:predicted HAD superfamily phosphohydrolase